MQIGGHNQWRIERAKLADYITDRRLLSAEDARAASAATCDSVRDWHRWIRRSLPSGVNGALRWDTGRLLG